MVPRENKNNAYAKFGGTEKEYCMWYFPKWLIPDVDPELSDFDHLSICLTYFLD